MSVPRNITIERSEAVPMDQQPFELVERKGIGHPDTICDSIMEAVCIDLCREYNSRFGHICHHNIDKGLLVAGRSLPKTGGGMILEPMKLIFGDRATYTCNGQLVPVGEIAEAAAKRWIRENLRFVDPDQHLLFQNEIKPGSPELTDAFARKVIGANDTSVGVGYAPFSETERIVLATEQFLNSPALKERFPEAGEDVKIMGCRNGRKLQLTVAVAFVDRFIPNANHYFERKSALRHELLSFIESQSCNIDSVAIDINSLDDPSRGEEGVYLTVLGTSAEGGDGGQVGRGNRVNGLIAFNRNQTMEAAAGKNPVNHVGKIYNVLSHELARRIHREIEGVVSVTVFLCSQIGKPVDRPLMASARITPEPGANMAELQSRATSIIDRELDGIDAFCQKLADGEFRVC
ncbi:MAG TPA: methionine adenosyltransferase [Chlorobaculum sp.]|uniref:S-adenosylmethionine synthase, archaeal-type n=1 Tax=Chlorobaculum tepidum (strain ATCC 49652 / DSM 12025 / NBRC 103806 / TLS) TaxID=194439 RepID=Q8KEZ2_CHLTE|nr:methionine adenosyltransferase [Chlorobaculum tepidum]AAM71782.1 S-adenosylmethionine synthase, archaeal-type [Chlorobaculum tepidum TLS]HBU24020.1 methionine adenosyltransferase [Chlorobaculum sp.]